MSSHFFIKLSLLVLLGFTFPTLVQAAETDTCASQCQTASTTEQRQECNQCRLEQDQANLKQIRETEDVQQAAADCQSDYEPEDDDPTGPEGAAGMFVPVHEVGQLLSLAQSTNAHTYNIDMFTGQTYDINVLLCMYLHAVKRVQYAFEDLSFIKEPDMRRQAAAKIEDYKEGLLGENGLIQTGYSPSTGEATGDSTSQGGSSLYPKNLNEYQKQAAEEGTAIAKDTLTNGGKNDINSFLTTSLNTLNDDNPAVDALRSTLSKTEYNSFIGNTDTDLSDTEWWQTMASYYDPSRPNNPDTAYFHTDNYIRSAIANNVEVAISEYQAGQGFLPVRTCSEYTSDGKACLTWTTITPGQIVKQSASDALKTRLDEYTNAELGQTGNNNEPVVAEVGTFSPVAGSDYDNTNYTDNTETNPDNGGDDNGGGNDGGGDDNGGGDSSEDDPIVAIAAATTNSGTRWISWVSNNTSSCKTKNAWLGSTDNESKLLDILRTRSQSVGKSGNIYSYIPLSFDLVWSKDNGTDVSDGVATSTNSRGTSIVDTWTVPKPSKQTDIYTLTIKDANNTDGYTIRVGGVAGSYSTLTAGGLVQAFAKYQKNNPNSTVFNYYTFSYNASSTKPNLVVKITEPVYKITCTGTNGNTVSASSED